MIFAGLVFFVVSRNFGLELNLPAPPAILLMRRRSFFADFWLEILRRAQYGAQMLCRLLIAVAACAVAVPALAAAPLQPFGSHPVPYAAGTIRPNHLTQAALDQQVRAFYDDWKARYLRQGCGAGRYHVLAKTDASNLTVSEAHGYGMLLAVLMAGHDPAAQQVFDGLYAYFRAHPTDTHRNLMSWYQDTTCANAGGVDSATDGDLDIALALLMADRQWNGCQAIDYHAEALRVIADIAHGDRDPTATILWLGDWVGGSSARYRAATRSSDLMPGHLRSFAAATGDASWSRLLDATYGLVGGLQQGFAPGTGLLPDFIENALTTPVPAAPNFLEGANDGAYDYNACRAPWRLGTDAALNGDARGRAAVQKMSTWIRTASAGAPAAIASGYRLNGAISPGADYLSMAFVAPFGVAAMSDPAAQPWLNAVWDRVVATPASAEGYYENTIKLMSMIVMSGNWWSPEAVPRALCARATATPRATFTPTRTRTPRRPTPTPTRRSGFWPWWR